MKTIWKYVLELYQSQAVQMPEGATVLDVQMQGDKVTMWAVVDSNSTMVYRSFWIAGTGHPLADNFLEHATYIGTVQESPFVWHVFEVHNEKEQSDGS